MVLLKKLHVFWVIVVLAILAAVLLNVKYPGFVEKTFLNKNFELLNKLSHTQGEFNLDYYQGRIEDRVLGPITNVLSFIALICLCLMYAQNQSFINFALLIFVFLSLSKFNILFYPPYGDAIGGPFAEALWLKDHHFDYIGLFHQPGYLEGGQKVYIFTIYPAFLAVLYTLIPNVLVFLVVNHLLVYAMAAIVIAVAREIFMKNFDGLSAALGSLVILALPLFQSQTEAINMEMPQLFFSMLAVWALVRSELWKACLWAIFALSIKGLGVAVCMTVFITAVYVFFKNEKKKHDWRKLMPGLIALICAFLGLASKYLVNDAHVSQGMVKFFVGWASLRTMSLPALFGGSVGLLIVYIINDKWSVVSGKRKEMSILTTDHLSFITQMIVLLMCTMCLMLFLNFKAVSPRYQLGLLPFLVMSVIFSISNFRIPTLLLRALLILTVGIISFGSFGRYYYQLGANYHVLSERSLEYRNNVKLDMKLSKLLEETFNSYTIGAPFIYAQMLNIPELGYIKKPLNVVQYGFPTQYQTIKPFEGLDKLNIMKTVWIGLAADHTALNGMTYPIHSQDKILKEFVLGDNKATLFMGGISIHLRWEMIQRYLKERGMNHK